jgi:hypothetical protein
MAKRISPRVKLASMERSENPSSKAPENGQKLEEHTNELKSTLDQIDASRNVSPPNEPKTEASYEEPVPAPAHPKLDLKDETWDKPLPNPPESLPAPGAPVQQDRHPGRRVVPNTLKIKIKKKAKKEKVEKAEKADSDKDRKEQAADEAFDQVLLLQKQAFEKRRQVEELRTSYMGDPSQFTEPQLQEFKAATKAFERLNAVYLGALATLPEDEQDNIRSLVEEAPPELPRPYPAAPTAEIPHEDEFNISLKPSPDSPPRVAHEFKPFEPAQVEPDAEDFDALNEQIHQEQKLVDLDKNNSIPIHGDKERLRRLIDRRSEMIRERARQGAAEPAPDAPATKSGSEEVVPAPEKSSAEVIVPQEELRPESSKPKSFEQVLTLQKDAFLARRDAMKFRHGKKVDDLSDAESARYKELRELAQSKREAWRAELALLPQEQQDELNGLTQLKQVEARFADLPSPDRIVMRALMWGMEENKRDLAVLNARIAEQKRIIEEVGPDYKRVSIGGAGESLNDELRDMQFYQRALMARIKDAENKLTEFPQETAPVGISETEPIQEEDPKDPLSGERAQANSRGRWRTLFRAGANAISKKVASWRDKLKEIPRWKVFPYMEAEEELAKAEKGQARLERELDKNRPGYGTKFKDRIRKAYRSTINHMKGGWDEAPAGQPPVPPGVPPRQEPVADPEPIPQPEPERVVERRSRSKFWWERLRGFVTFGGYDYLQGGRMQIRTNAAARKLENDAKKVTVDANAGFQSSEDAAQEFAMQVKAEMEAQGIRNSDDPRFVEISSEIINQRVRENNLKIDAITRETVTKVSEKLKNYRNVDGELLNDDAKNKLAAEIRKQLTAMRRAAVAADVGEAAQAIRRALDPEWKKHYRYGAIETALWGALIGGYLYLTKETVVHLETTIWAIAKQQCIDHGIAQPTNSQIMKMAIQLCKDSHVKVVTKAGQILWNETAGGVFKDIALKKGFPVIVSGAGKIATVMKASMAAGI